MSYIGIDIGGTNTKYGLVSNNGDVLVSKQIPTDHDFDTLIDNLVIECKALVSEAKDEVLGIGVGCPGIVNSSSGVVEYSCNLEWEYVPLGEALESRLGIKVRVSNDANIATLGETIYGAGAGYNNAIMLTLGTGVGGGIIIDKHIYDGNHGAGAELGHMVVEVDGKKCGCGMKGCLEAYASARAFIRATVDAMTSNPESKLYKECNGESKNVTIFTPFEVADSVSKKVIDEYIKYLGHGILNYCNIFRPEVVILGGGMSHVGEPLLSRLRAFIEKHNYGYKHSPSVEIRLATLENSAGIVGGRALFLE